MRERETSTLAANHRPKVLVVDDTVECGQLLRYLLMRLGYAAEYAPSGEEALARLERDPLPDLVILDQMMPGLDGMEVLRRMRAAPRTSGVAIALFSAIGDPAFRDYALEKGADAYWVKAGIDYSKLDEMIEALLRREGRAVIPSDGEGFTVRP